MLDPTTMNATGRATHPLQASQMPSEQRILLFGRYPVPGQTKTRLIPALGPVGAADLQRRLTEKTLDTLLHADVPAASIVFCHSGGTRSQLQRWLGRAGIGFDRQQGADLGARMDNAFRAAFRFGCARVVMVGTDIPALTPDHLDTALEALRRHDLVLGPSRDGGYWLIGMRRPLDLFQNIKWGGPQVLTQTLAAAGRLGLSVAQLETLNDIDTPADLSDWPSPEYRRTYLTVIIPALNEAGNISRTIEAAQAADSEILLADGGSSDQTISIARAAGIAVIQAPRGRAIQQNTAARHASGRVLLFLHADTRLPADYPAQVFETLMDPAVVAGAFGFKADWNRRDMRLIEQTVRLRATLFQLPYGDQGLFMPRAVFARAGGFPLVPVAEDLLLVRQLKKLGRIALAPGSAVTSARRWRARGLWRTTLRNYLIAGACLAGIDPKHLAPLLRSRLNRNASNGDPRDPAAARHQR